MPISGGEEKHGGLCTAERLPLLSRGVLESIERHEYALLQYIEVLCPINTVHKMLRFVCLRWGNDDKVDHGQRRCTGISKKLDLSLRQWLAMERLQALKGFTNVARSSHAVASFSGRIPCSLRRYYPNKFYTDC